MQSIVQQWYGSFLQELLARRNSMPHALLLTGANGIGKGRFAKILAAALLCKQPNNDQTACGQCQSCKLFAASTHPDLYHIDLLNNDDGKQAKEIKVDQIRQLTQALTQTSQLGGVKIAVINQADKMNRNAANSLLKTLEEPTADTLLILLSAYPSRLLPTIRSRCQTLVLKTPGRVEVINWLQQNHVENDAVALCAAADGAPFAAQALTSGALDNRRSLFEGFSAIAGGRQDPVTLAAEWTKYDPLLVFRWLKSWIQDLISLASGRQNPLLNNTDLQKGLHELVSRIDLHKLFNFHDLLQHSELLSQGSANMQLVYESILLEWSKQHTTKSH